jgi:hypothetical protein
MDLALIIQTANGLALLENCIAADALDVDTAVGQLMPMSVTQQYYVTIMRK